MARLRANCRCWQFFGTINNGGTFSLVYNGSTLPIPVTFDTNTVTLTANIKATLDGFFGVGNTLVTSTSATTYTIAFTGDLANANVQALTITANTLTGTGTFGVSNFTISEGTGNEVQTLSSIAGAGGGDSITIAFNGVAATTALTAPAMRTAAEVQTNLETIPVLTGNVMVVGATGGPFTIVFRGVLAGANLFQLTVTPAGAGAATPGTVSEGGFTNEVQTFTQAAGIAVTSTAQAANSQIVTVTATAHGLLPGQVVRISGALASSHIGTWTVLAVTGANTFTFLTANSTAAVNGAAGGTVVGGLGYRGVFTAPVNGLAASSTIASDPLTVQGQLELLPNVGAGNVTVSGPIGGPYIITFKGTLASRDHQLMTINSGTVIETTPGGGTLLVSPASNAAFTNIIAVGANNALGVGGVSARSTVTSTSVGLRPEGTNIVLPNPVDISTAAGGLLYEVLATLTTTSGFTFTYNNTIFVNLTTLNPHLINPGASLAGTPTVIYAGAAAGGVAIDLGNLVTNGGGQLQFRNYSTNVSSITGSIVDSPGLVAQGAFLKQNLTANFADGTGLLILSGNNTFDGTLTIGVAGLAAPTGTLVRITNSNALGSLENNVVINTGAALELAGGGPLGINRPLSLASSGFLIPTGACAALAALIPMPARSLWRPVRLSAWTPAACRSRGSFRVVLLP